ncbi:MAG: ubiquinol-cytochrome c reductase iron-sulfur subunit [Chromatiaceae bacterium]|nr:ubiquinol-cytochrome c reductase iron-sulfur subunit [Gammaproteobacteria bacterium]MCP5447337.1 ubiquinol-cytochrome c reductase iron-sulfur subunit [Chromatiaceae bacterium]MCB1861468.1 ubiquinol-cytochrome c reductase iron-sulfur subunit [Gammaproteobacteria bacterium]MCB1873336.1 ubiquinol-cytochrome c reductase iron-sulfur subunit [Gammaproteobacteria bacterium]MCB1878722.1 ubiquinol-cytochrome c reductase iron-sulfur subunit [Gammaproteobacteria bacterium]
MSADGVDLKKRRMLTAATSVVGAVGAGYVVYPFLASWAPSEKAKAAGAPVEADISKLEPGQLMRVKWRGKPVWIVRRTEKNIADLAKLDDRLVDPTSEMPQQPEYCKNPTRSRKPEFLVAVGICTHLGCSPTFRPDLAPADLGPEWLGGFFCPCHGSRFDLAGRVFSGVPAPTNLVIPPYQFLSDTRILVGDDGGAS